MYKSSRQERERDCNALVQPTNLMHNGSVQVLHISEIMFSSFQKEEEQSHNAKVWAGARLPLCQDARIQPLE